MCVFNINLCVFDSLSTIRHERELSLVLTYPSESYFVCAQKTVFQKSRLTWFKTHDFSASCKGPILEKGAGAAAHLYLKRHAQKWRVSASTQNKQFSKLYNK